ncbi:helix-turn-helix transcriptional regulator [Apibacter muscae]|uniref:helix-turn-helix transcriptional regulator n=1 Tax=Apibacter muscae TaxID=2509004 RepID=UPI001629190A|nr:sigma factor-like helix-turn-helix DNA-binding protein [Apibacter muscae]
MKELKLDTQKAFKYYCLGLNSKEIAKLLDCSYRTVQNYMSAENWKEKRNQLKPKNKVIKK